MGTTDGQAVLLVTSRHANVSLGELEYTRPRSRLLTGAEVWACHKLLLLLLLQWRNRGWRHYVVPWRTGHLAPAVVAIAVHHACHPIMDTDSCNKH